MRKILLIIGGVLVLLAITMSPAQGTEYEYCAHACPNQATIATELPMTGLPTKAFGYMGIFFTAFGVTILLGTRDE